MFKTIAVTVTLLMMVLLSYAAEPARAAKISRGAHVYVAPMGGFENYVTAGITNKNVPVMLVTDRDKAEYEIQGSSETQQSDLAKMLFSGSQNTSEKAWISVQEIKTGTVVFAYSVNKPNSNRGKQSTGEDIGKHLNEVIEKENNTLPAFAREGAKNIPANAKVYMPPMDGFEKDLKVALETKQVPLEIVSSRDRAEFEITGTSESQEAGLAKKMLFWSWQSNEEASIRVSNLKTGEIVFAYSVNKLNSFHGRRSTAEACAKHLKEQVETPFRQTR